MQQNKEKSPALVIEYTDAEEGFQGWLVIDTLDHNLCAGGMRVQPGLSRDRLARMARNMTCKMRICGLRVEVINHSREPVMASHSAAWSVANRGGNLIDRVLDLMQETGGFAFVSFNTNSLVSPGADAAEGIKKFVGHIQYLEQKLGSDFIGIGSDYQADGKYVPDELNKANTFQRIAEELKAIGYTEGEVKNIVGGNFLRAMGVQSSVSG